MPYYAEALAALQSMIDAEKELRAHIDELDRKAMVEVNATLSSTTLTTSTQSLPMLSTSTLRKADTPNFVNVANARLLRDKHTEWARKIHGVMMGYAREMQSAQKNILKGRKVGFEGADVTVGETESFAKAIQHKHTVSMENSAVNEMIAKAANQLTGESGEAPLAGQRKIIDVMINDPRNWWPFDLKDFEKLEADADLNSGVIPIKNAQARGVEQILAQLTKYKPKSSGLDKATIRTLATSTTMGRSGVHTQGKSSIVYNKAGDVLPVLTIKIIYGQPRTFKNGPGTIVVSKMVFTAYRSGNNLTVRFEKNG
jgi:hypothetical protein